MTVKEFKEIFKGDIKFFDYATGKAIGEEFKTEENKRLQELEIADIELGIKTNSIKLDKLYENSIPFVKVFVDIGTKTLKMREAIRTVAMSLYNTWYIRDTEDNLLYSNDEYVKGDADPRYMVNIKDLPIKILNSLVTKIRTAFHKDTSEWSITFNIINEEEEE
jgi:hypothetical protein